MTKKTRKEGERERERDRTRVTVNVATLGNVSPRSFCQTGNSGVSARFLRRWTKNTMQPAGENGPSSPQNLPGTTAIN